MVVDAVALGVGVNAACTRFDGFFDGGDGLVGRVIDLDHVRCQASCFVRGCGNHRNDITVKDDFIFNDRQVVFDYDTHHRVASDICVGRDAHDTFYFFGIRGVNRYNFAGCDIGVTAHAVQHAG